MANDQEAQKAALRQQVDELVAKLAEHLQEDADKYVQRDDISGMIGDALCTDLPTMPSDKLMNAVIDAVKAAYIAGRLDSMPEPERAALVPKTLWSELLPNGREIYYEGDNPEADAAEIKAATGFDPSETWEKDISGYRFFCPAEYLDAVYGGPWLMGS